MEMSNCSFQIVNSTNCGDFEDLQMYVEYQVFCSPKSWYGYCSIRSVIQDIMGSDTLKFQWYPPKNTRGVVFNFLIVINWTIMTHTTGLYQMYHSLLSDDCIWNSSQFHSNLATLKHVSEVLLFSRSFRNTSTSTMLVIYSDWHIAVY